MVAFLRLLCVFRVCVVWGRMKTLGEIFQNVCLRSVPYVNDEYISLRKEERSHTYYLGARWTSHLRSTLGVRPLVLLNIKKE